MRNTQIGLVLAGVLLSLLSGCSEAEDEGPGQTAVDGTAESQPDTSDTWEFTPIEKECETTGDCDDGIECTEDFCTSENICEHILGAGFCLIDGQCLIAGSGDPVNVCGVCDPLLWTDKWSSNHNQPCDDGNPCTDNELCNKLECIGEAVTPCCGNGVVEEGETCDGNCDDLPLECAPEPCAIPTRIGSKETCDLTCTDTIEFACGTTDGCCPDGCALEDDADCLSACGDGILQEGELCDGDCPRACDDEDPCTVDTYTGSVETCDAICIYEPAPCGGEDGCCSQGCTIEDDVDCLPTCGDGVLDEGEVCDGNCPTSCEDGNLCTDDTLTGDADTCDALCAFAPIPCDDGVPCTVDTCVAGSGCVHTGDDSLCASGEPCVTDTCDAATGCTSILEEICCGNGLIEDVEECDDGNTVDGDGCSASCVGDCVVEEDTWALFSPATWEGGLADCAARGGDLAWIHSAQEQEVAFNLCNQITNSNAFCWIGLESPYSTWSNGDPVDFAFWGADFDGTGTCANLKYTLPDGAWDDFYCGTSVHYVCRFPSAVSPDLSGAIATATSPAGDLTCCGNGIVDPGETCDGNCPTCFTSNPCTGLTLVGSASTCDAACVPKPSPGCSGGDECCPLGCNPSNDEDCSTQCNVQIDVICHNEPGKVVSYQVKALDPSFGSDGMAPHGYLFWSANWPAWELLPNWCLNDTELQSSTLDSACIHATYDNADCLPLDYDKSCEQTFCYQCP